MFKLLCPTLRHSDSDLTVYVGLERVALWHIICDVSWNRYVFWVSQRQTPELGQPNWGWLVPGHLHPSSQRHPGTNSTVHSVLMAHIWVCLTMRSRSVYPSHTEWPSEPHGTSMGSLWATSPTRSLMACIRSPLRTVLRGNSQLCLESSAWKTPVTSGSKQLFAPQPCDNGGSDDIL